MLRKLVIATGAVVDQYDDHMVYGRKSDERLLRLVCKRRLKRSRSTDSDIGQVVEFTYNCDSCENSQSDGTDTNVRNMLCSNHQSLKTYGSKDSRPAIIRVGDDINNVNQQRIGVKMTDDKTKLLVDEQAFNNSFVNRLQRYGTGTTTTTSVEDEYGLVELDGSTNDQTKEPNCKTTLIRRDEKGSPRDVGKQQQQQQQRIAKWTDRGGGYNKETANLVPVEIVQSTSYEDGHVLSSNAYSSNSKMQKTSGSHREASSIERFRYTDESLEQRMNREVIHHVVMVHNNNDVDDNKVTKKKCRVFSKFKNDVCLHPKNTQKTINDDLEAILPYNDDDDDDEEEEDQSTTVYSENGSVRFFKFGSKLNGSVFYDTRKRTAKSLSKKDKAEDDDDNDDDGNYLSAFKLYRGYFMGAWPECTLVNPSDVYPMISPSLKIAYDEKNKKTNYSWWQNCCPFFGTSK